MVGGIIASVSLISILKSDAIDDIKK